MRKVFKPILPLLALVMILAGCQAMTGETVGETVDDTGITTRVKAALAADKGTSLTRVGVETTRGVVHLTGVVQSSADRSRAEQVTRGVSGVRGVTNNLQVGP
jgi:osmotically-inducible protein OsmY